LLGLLDPLGFNLFAHQSSASPQRLPPLIIFSPFSDFLGVVPI
jgi:hypothetical protein